MATSVDIDNVENALFIVFGLIIVAFLVIDLGLLNRKAKIISTESALYQTLFWISVSVVFGFIIRYYLESSGKMWEYFTAYSTEKALSVDNIFVIILILKYFRVKEEYYHKILFWGILGALMFRGAFIFLGAEIVSKWHFVLYIFGVVLLYSGIKLFFQGDDDDFNPEDSRVVKLCRKHLNLSNSDFGGKFFIRENGGLLFTPIFLVLILIETTDLIFAIDSIPAAFGITTDKFILYTSNIFAVLGLRAMFFLLDGILDKFYLLQKGLSFVLIFIGFKMLLDSPIQDYVPFLKPLNELFSSNHFLSFMIVFSMIFLSIALSIIFPLSKTELKEKESNP